MKSSNTVKIEMKEKELFGSSEIVRKTGISLRQLNYWVNNLKVAEPVLKPFGCRTFRRFSQEDFEDVKKMNRLVKRGYRPRAAAQIVKRQSLGITNFDRLKKEGRGSGRDK